LPSAHMNRMTPYERSRLAAARTHYEVLEVGPDATAAAIKKGYRSLAARTHPDIAGEAAKPLFLAVQAAYETLSKEGRRAAYDRELATERQAQAMALRAAETRRGMVASLLHRLMRAGRQPSTRGRRALPAGGRRSATR
jgi:DnaJ-class molecular chaperone